MAQPTGTFSANDMVGIREDLSDTIYNIDPVRTPGLSTFAHIDATAVLHEWQTDVLAAADATGAIEGDDAPADASTATVRLNNRTHIKTRDARVSGTGQSVQTAGRANELDYQMLKRANELKRDMEKVLFDNNAKVTGTDAVASETAGIPAWIKTSTDKGAGGVDPAGTGADARTDGTQRAFTEDQLKTVLVSVFNEGGEPDVLMAGGFNRQILSSFSAGRSNVQRAEDPVLHATFAVYESDFSELRIIPNRFQRARDVFALQTDMWAVAFLPGRNMLSFPLSKTGDTDARQILSEFAVEARNEQSSGIVADLTTS